ncbi:MAG: NrfD/PsrC family molybdoenzyme membrane anchor subunit, partial [Deltaproteobacteria bacterium]|nr:NrfD/PsrC family molybdoenzyme membrane anchor subunit [Deltaproteobacteria bacterium]
ALALLLALVVLFAASVYFRQFATGLGVTGLNRPGYWGVYIVNFVFFIGVSAGGIMIASLVHAFGFAHFRSVARIAELMAISCLLLAICFIVLDLGRPDRLLYIMLYPHPGSPLFWDVTAVNVYLVISLVYGYLGTRADLVRVMHAKPHVAWFYRLLALGHTDLSPRTLEREQRILKVLACLGLIAAVALHSVTAWIFGLQKAQPGWFASIMAPLFIVSATVSGLALLTFSVVTIRRLIEHPKIEDQVIRRLGVMLAFSVPVLGYFLFAELLTAFYSAEPSVLQIFHSMMYGTYASFFWGHLVLGLLLPMLLLLTVLGALPRGLVLGVGLVVTLTATGAAWYFQIVSPLERFPAYSVYGAGCMATFVLLALFGGGHIKEDIGIGIAGFLVVLGILAERWNIVVPSLVGHPFMVPGPVGYFPTLTEAVLTCGVYAFGGLFFIFAAMLLPLVESEEDEAPPPAPDVSAIEGPRWTEIEDIKTPRWSEIKPR